MPQGKLAPTMPSLSRPAKGVRIKEPSFGTCLVRATDHTAEGLSKFSRNYYSRRQAFNANNTYFITFSGDSWWNLYDAATLKYVRKLSPRVPNPSLDKQYHIGSDSEVVWHPTDPNSLYYLSSGGGTKLMKLDVRNNTYQVVADFKGKLPSWASGVTKVWTRWEGSPSKDARYWGFQMEASGKRLGFFVWDLQQNKLVGSMQSSISSDHTSMSPSGRWIVIADTASGTGTWAYSPDFKTKKKLFATSGHSDLAIGANGHDYYAGIDYASSKGDVFIADIDSCPAVSASASSAPYCPRTVLFQLYDNGSSSPMHISGKAYDRPGWLMISTYATRNSRDGRVPWYANKVFAMEMGANPRVYPIAYNRFTKASGDDYWSETHASTNRDMTRIIYNSNWGASNYEDVDTYIVKLPKTALPGGVVTPAPSRVTGGNLRPSAGSPIGVTSASLKPSTTPATSSADASASTTQSTTWISPGMRFVRNAVTALREASDASETKQLSIPQAAFLSVPSLAWLRSVLVEEKTDEQELK